MVDSDPRGSDAVKAVWTELPNEALPKIVIVVEFEIRGQSQKAK